MAELGRALLILALIAAVYGVGASLLGLRRGALAGGAAWVASGRRAAWALAGFLTLAFVLLEAAFLRSDFSFQVVADNSSTTTPLFYRATAVWSSQEGSLLLWVWLLSLWTGIALFLLRRRLREIAPWATAVLLGLASFFLALLVFSPEARPFAQLASPPAEGQGLNPLLRHPAMMIHPPLLYAGYTLSAVPFAFAIGALITRKLGADWLSYVRRYALAGWFFLGLGILLGARWSYSELGWGGYWAWDAVENASLLPWLTGTAFLHSAMIQERRGMLKVWNVALVLATGVLAVLGTFLVRSGVLDSIHAFGASTLGGPFLGLVAVMLIASVALVVSRREGLRSERSFDSLLSREAIFLLQNLVLVGLAFAVFWGTFFPLISEALTGTRHSVGPPYFNAVTVPLALVVVLLTGVGPLIAWRRATPSNLRRSFLVPGVFALVVLAVLAALGAASKPLAWLMFGFAAFMVACTVRELWRGVRARRAMTGEAPPLALVRLVGRNRRRYGGYLVHVGMATLFVGVAASSSFKDTKDVNLKPGESAEVGGYTVRYVKPIADGDAEKLTFGSVMSVARPGEKPRELVTSRGFYASRDGNLGQLGRFFEGEATSEVGLRAGATRDVWTVVNPDLGPLRREIEQGDKLFAAALAKARAAGDAKQIRGLFAARDAAIVGLARRWVTRPWAAPFRLIVSPLVTWIWVGGIIVFAGGLLALWPTPAAARGRVRARYAARVGRELADRA